MKGTTKRKMYQKRRKREKAEQHRKNAQSVLPEKAATAFKINNKYNKNTQNNQYNNNKNYQQQQKLYAFNPITSYSQGLQLWWQTYCHAIKFHSQQQEAQQSYVQENYSTLLQKYADEYETSSEEEDNETAENTYDEIDEEYIKFLVITHKHREEMRLKRAKENC